MNRHEEAMWILFKLAQQYRADAASKDLLLDVIKALPDGDPLVIKYRRKLYTLWVQLLSFDGNTGTYLNLESPTALL